LTPHPPTLEQAIAEIMALDRVVVGLDFDGTIAPIVEHPDLAVPDPMAVNWLQTLATMPGMGVVIVSGRAFDDLRRRLGEVPGVTLVGEHGNDYGAREPRPAVLEDAIEVVTSLGDRTPGAIVEVKQFSVTFHTRNVSGPRANEALAFLHRWASERKKLTVLEGKEVLELSVATRTKGDAIMDIGVDADAIVFIGDDKTDETVFEALRPGDVGVKVGEGDTAAQYRIPDVNGVGRLLETMAEMRRRRV
jgi:trehalose-phosphatase